jgi:dihydroorotate dehydrogenase
MKLSNGDYGKVWGASGVQGFFGEGYPHHNIYKTLIPGFSFKGMTFVSKTITLSENKGNMPLREDKLTPQEFKPRCIIVKPIRGEVLNAVGLSGPGAEWLFNRGIWQKFTEPFVLSFMPLAKDRFSRMEETREFVKIFQNHLPQFKAPVALQINFSCPNTGHDLEKLADEVLETLQIASRLHIPLIPKFNVLIPPEKAAAISKSPLCEAICVSNTVPWGEFPEDIDWKKIFGSEVSPLTKHFGPEVKGGYSGPILAKLVLRWIEEAEKRGIEKPINAGGGIFTTKDIDALAKHEKVKSIFLGSVAILRPWKLQTLIEHGNRVLA